MGNLISKFTSSKGTPTSKKLVKPRNLQSLADSVAVSLIQNASLEASLESNPWASAFAAYLERKDRESGSTRNLDLTRESGRSTNLDLTNMFHFFIFSSALKIASKECPDRVEILLNDIRDKFFMDSLDTAKPIEEMKTTVKVEDDERKVHDIFRLFRSGVMKSLTAQDRQKLERQIISLRQDENINDKLDGEAYTDFMSRPPCICQCPFHCPSTSQSHKDQATGQQQRTGLQRQTCNIVLGTPQEGSPAKQPTLL